MIKLIATDLDGSFLNDQKSYDQEKFAKIYQKLLKKGINFVVASGDQYYHLASIFKQFPETIYVAENGAYVRSLEHEYAVSSFQPETAKEIIAVLERIPEIDYIVCGKRAAYVKEDASEYFWQLMHCFYQKMEKVPNFKALNDPILKLSLTSKPDQTKALISDLQAKLGSKAILTDSGNGNIDIIQPKINKAWGLKTLGKKLQIKLSEMAAFGDAGNDLEMIKEVGVGIAMQNAQEQIKEVADDITLSNNESGVLTKIEEMIK